ncbi:1-deoxy-D-xylulose-5-phosphate reductoisomerase [uncultured Desulfobacter sp.]|uniref:1-deoxy-D-xylulose-5-phosphate reductoisomerase n=1 Tax=uncultured Desulfobacter sp. TaxID=240139 RepID=UPI0029F487C9|nr:1-deoxy-D-xylulose-5-phosphate reductoisomerase [uncultured Desulfobacter sp.]
MKSLTILGSTGSIGTSALKVVGMHPDKFSIKSLTCATNIDLLVAQITQFQPDMVAVLNEQSADRLSKMLSGRFCPEILWGEAGFIAAAQWADSDMVLAAMVGAAGLAPALAAIDAGKQLALANKETLVMAGDIVMARAREKGVDILPVDSEHCAIFQCLQGNRKRDLKKIFLTASGGPFRDLAYDQFRQITPAQALDHPTWDMGAKISIDSATLMNKALEVIEAVRLFDVSVDQIQVIIHPQSIVHSMVGFKDGGIMAQLGKPDMMHAIAYAFSYPERVNLDLNFPDFAGMSGLTFDDPDTKRFPSLGFACEACRRGGTLPAVMNAANEIVVDAFLKEHIGFPDIFTLIREVMDAHTCIDNPELSGIIEADLWAREKTQSLVQRLRV